MMRRPKKARIQYHNKHGYEKPNRKKKKPIRMRDYVTYEDKRKDKMGSK